MTDMQTLQPVFGIEETTRKNNLLEIISDVYCRTMLKSIMNKPKSAIEISKDESIPTSTVYRRLQTLQGANLVSLSGTISDDGKKTFFYKSKIKEIEGRYEDGQVKVKAVFNG